jgi:soluble lytic murein transglycosylase
MRLFLKSLLLAALAGASSAAAARLRAVTISTEQEWSAPRWMHDSKAKVKGPAVVKQLVNLRKAHFERKFGDCVEQARRLSGMASGIKMWLAAVELDCAVQLAKPENSKTLAPLVQALDRVDQNPKWLLWGPQTETLRPLYAEGRLLRFERQVKIQRRQAWAAYDGIQAIRRWLTDEQRARMYRAAGELAFLEQDLGLAMEMMSRSLDQRDSSDVRRRLESIRSSVLGKKDAAPAAKSAPAAVAVEGASENEREIIDRMHRTTQSGDLLSAVEDGVRLIGKYPGSSAAKWASDRILEIYLSLGAKSEGNFPTLREKSVDFMLKADGARLARWANNAFVKGFYKDAARMGEGAINKFNGHPDATKVMLMTGQAAVFSGDHSGAEKWYERLIQEHNGTDESKTAMIRLGLIHFRAKKWTEASSYFEKVLAQAPGTDWEYLALHWHWRAQQKLKAPQAPQIAERLINRFPLTYYGLRARAELNNGKLAFEKSPNVPVRSEVWLSESQSQGWERFQLLLKAGWFDEAQAELNALPEPLSPEDKLVRARLLAAAFDHLQSIRLFNEVWTQKPEIFSWSLARAAFPVEYIAAVEKEAKATQLDESLIRGLMRQESSFRARAQSASNAHGVMQVLPATAAEVAAMNKWKATLVLPEDLYNPDINIRVGSIYLARLVKAFKGHVPLALAAYNAGIGRMRKWLGARSELSDLESKKTSAPEEELWIDELPWEETSTYIKAVLRNLLIYQLYGKGSMTLQDPVWQTSKP